MGKRKGSAEERAKDWVRSVLEEKLARQRRRAKELLKSKIHTRADVENAMKVLCFNHLAYCCGVDRKCGYRDELLKAVGLTKDDYARYKRKCENILWTNVLPIYRVVK